MCDKIRGSVAISVLSKSTVCFYELLHRDLVRTEYKCYIMVKAIPLPKQEEQEDELPNFEPTSEEESKPPVDPKDAWRLPTFQEIEEELRETIKKKGVHPVDPISIALKQNPITVKDVNKAWIKIAQMRGMEETALLKLFKKTNSK